MNEKPILSAGGAAFVGMRLMSCGSTQKSTGSLHSGTGTLAAKYHMLLRGEASPALKACLATAAGWAGQIPLMARKLLVQFRADQCPDILLDLTGKTRVIVISGSDEEAPASLVVSLVASDPKDDGVLWAGMDRLKGLEGTLVLLPPKRESGEQELPIEPGDVAPPAPPITVHAPGLDPTVTTAESLAVDIATVREAYQAHAAAKKGMPKGGKGSTEKGAELSCEVAMHDLGDGPVEVEIRRDQVDVAPFVVRLAHGPLGMRLGKGPTLDEALDDLRVELAKNPEAPAPDATEEVPAAPAEAAKPVRRRKGKAADAVA